MIYYKKCRVLFVNKEQNLLKEIQSLILSLEIRLQTEGEFKTNNYTESRDINMIFKVFIQSICSNFVLYF